LFDGAGIFSQGTTQNFRARPEENPRKYFVIFASNSCGFGKTGRDLFFLAYTQKISHRKSPGNLLRNFSCGADSCDFPACQTGPKAKKFTSFLPAGAKISML
jgi:hypothetical protein